MIRSNALRRSEFARPGFIALILVLGFSFATPAQEQPAQPGQAPMTPQQEASLRQSEAPETLHLMVGRSLVITSPARIQRVSVADPKVVEAIVVSPNQIMMNGKTPGAASLILWDESGQNQTFDVYVDLDILGLTQDVRSVFPDQPVRVQATKDVVVLSGRVASKEVADKVLEMGKAVSPKVISLMEVPMPPTSGEILLQVRFAEVDRTAVSELGVNIMSLPPAKTIGAISTQAFGAPQLPTNAPLSANTGGFTLTDILNVFIFRPDINLAATMKLLQSRNLLQILAEPNLLTQTGKQASFLAGGEFPYPVLQGGLGFNAITIQFREFGIRLDFTPTLTADGNVHLKVRPEVSALDFANALTLQGFTIPALSTRRVESEMDLKDGQSFAIAGLVDNRVTEQFQKIPGIGDIPLFGKLFQSRTLNKTKNELLVVVTPRIVRPSTTAQVPAGPQFPKEFLTPAVPEKQPANAQK